jgi:hypothetical protein
MVYSALCLDFWTKKKKLIILTILERSLATHSESIEGAAVDLSRFWHTWLHRKNNKDG